MLGGVILGLLPSSLLSLLSHLLQSFTSTHRLGLLLQETFAHSFSSVKAVWKMNEEVLDYRQQFHDLFTLSKLDLLLCPTMALPAIGHEQTIHLLPVVMYSSIFNVLEYPVGHVPITRVRQDECFYGEGEGRGGRGDPGREGGDDLITRMANEQMKSSEGLPVGVSVIGLPYDDESVLNVMKILEKRFPFVPSL
jgi:fatty acid amide hydrolase